MSREDFPILIRVILNEQANLTEVVQAANASRLRFGLAEGRQEHSGKDRDDGDDHQQFDEREPGRNLPRLKKEG